MMKKRFCKHGHDTAVSGRTSGYACKACIIVKRQNRSPEQINRDNERAKKCYSRNRTSRLKRNAEYYQKNKERYVKYRHDWHLRNCESVKARHRRSLLWDRYRITPEQYDAMLKAQGGVCAICKSAMRSKKKMHVDHDHATGHVRGILCTRCNFAIAYLRDEPRLIESALRYVRRHAQLRLVINEGVPVNE